MPRGCRSSWRLTSQRRSRLAAEVQLDVEVREPGAEDPAEVQRWPRRFLLDVEAAEGREGSASYDGQQLGAQQ
jgi:hypothetical protein